MIDRNKITTLDSLDTILPAFENKILKQLSDNNTIEPRNDDIPVIHITGTVPTNKFYVRGTLQYTSKTYSFSAYIKYKLQGNYTLLLPKKNFTIKLYTNEQRTASKYMNFKNWGNMDKFVLKADHNDITHARNVVSAKLWGKVVQSRSDYDSLPEEMRNTPNNCAIDGFPVLVYINNEYQGIYNFTLPKSPLVFGMDKKNNNHVALQSEINDVDSGIGHLNPCNFNQSWDGNETYFSYEIGKDAVNSFNNLYQYIYATPNVNTIKNYLDIQSAIDYYIFHSVIYNVDGLARNMILLTYDKIKWYLSSYDMDNTFGLLGGSKTIEQYQNQDSAYEAMPGSSWFFNMHSELWYFLQTNFSEQIEKRYLELRKGVLSYHSIMSEFENYINLYGEDLYIKDVIAYPSIPNVDYNNIHNLRSFVKRRLANVDTVILGRVLNG